jgi:ATP-dependent RNA helicase DeaD
MENFQSFGLPQQLLQSIERLKFTTPTPIQVATIPLALKGKDILGSAQTGTGKTAAFGLPLLAKLLANPQGSALVITPTRELATQVMQALKDLLGHSTPIKTALIIGGESMGKQLQQLKMRPRLFVGTPGRINDHLTRGTLKLNDTNFLVLDEMDRMLDMGFSIQIEKITKHLPKERQTLLFSATMPQDILKLAASYLNQPERVSIGSHSNPAANIKHEMMALSEVDKYAQLLTQLDKREGSIIIFIKTKYGAEKMAKRLKDDHHSADALHGDLRHNKRESVIKAFRNSKYRILVATDVASRGLDIPHIEHVINYDLPQCPEDYIHRIGRTARAGAEGEAICFVTPAERGKWHAINRLMNPNAAPEPRGERAEPRGASRGAPRGDSRSDGRRPAKNYARTSTSGYARGNAGGKPSGNSGGTPGGNSRSDSRGSARPERSGEPRRDQKPKSYESRSHESRGQEPGKSWGDKPKSSRSFHRA